jgi:hypothetical protein
VSFPDIVDSIPKSVRGLLQLNDVTPSGGGVLALEVVLDGIGKDFGSPPSLQEPTANPVSPQIPLLLSLYWP